MSEEKVFIEDDLIYMTVSFYEMMREEDPSGDALELYWHLVYTARRQQTNQVWADEIYLRRGLGMGEKKVKRAKGILHRLGIIEYIKTRENGRFTKQYILIKKNITRGAISAPVVQKTTGVENDTGGSGKQMLKGNKEMLKGNKENPLRTVLYKKVLDSFTAKHPTFFPFKKEGPHIKRFVEICFKQAVPEVHAAMMIKGFWDLRQSNRREDWQFKGVDFLPSIMMSKYGLIEEYIAATTKVEMVIPEEVFNGAN